MPGKFQHIGDLFNPELAQEAKDFLVPKEKLWTAMTEDEKAEYLLTYCLRSQVFTRSDPAFGIEWFVTVHRTTEATMDDLKIVLEDCEAYMQELIERGAFKYKDVRRHVIYRLKKYLAHKAFLAKKKQSYNAPVQRVPAKIELPKEQLCPECKQYLPRDFFTLDGICVNCGQQECASCRELFKNKDMKMRRWKLYCKTCFEKL